MMIKARNLLLALSTLVAMFTAISLRDAELVGRLQTISEQVPAEFYDERILCEDLPTCYRVAHKLVVGASAVLIAGSFALLSSFQADSITDIESAVTQAENVLPHLVLRILVLVATATAVNWYLRKWSTTLILSNVVLVWLSGFPIRLLARGYVELRQALSIGEDYAPALLHHLSRQSTIFILEHDYAALGVVLLMPMVLVSIQPRYQALKYFSAGVLSTLVFEHLGLVLLVALLWMKRRSVSKTTLWHALCVFGGWLLPILLLTLYAIEQRVDGGSGLFDTIRYYSTTNREHQNVIVHFFIGFLLVPWIVGKLVGSVLLRGERTARPLHHLNQLQSAINGTIIGLVLAYLVGYFTSGLASEFGRQSLGAQVLLFISGLMAHQARHQRRVEQAVAVSAPGTAAGH